MTFPAPLVRRRISRCRCILPRQPCIIACLLPMPCHKIPVCRPVSYNIPCLVTSRNRIRISRRLIMTAPAKTLFPFRTCPRPRFMIPVCLCRFHPVCRMTVVAYIRLCQVIPPISVTIHPCLEIRNFTDVVTARTPKLRPVILRYMRRMYPSSHPHESIYMQMTKCTVPPCRKSHILMQRVCSPSVFPKMRRLRVTHLTYPIICPVSVRK